jgi:hypothetical protein
MKTLDWDLFAKTMRVLIRDLKNAGKVSAATASPARVMLLSDTLQRLIECWPTEKPETRREFAASKNSDALMSLLPPRETRIEAQTVDSSAR